MTTCAAVSRAEKLPFKTYTTAEGLAHDRVNEIVRDSRGFMWFCTGEGLSRFDGYEFKNYTQAHGLPHRSVNDLLELDDGTYLVATSDGLVVFNPKGVSAPRSAIRDPQSTDAPMFRTLRPAEVEIGRSPFAVSDLHKSRDGQIWAATYMGFYRLAREGERGWRFEKIEPTAWRGKSQEFLSIIEDRFGVLWLSAAFGLVRFQPESGEIITSIEKAAVASLFADSRGRIWAGHNDPGKPGLYLYDLPDARSQPVLTRRFTTEDGLNHNEWINHSIETRDGRILVGTPQGLCEYLPGSEPSFRVLVSSADIVSLAEDGDGNVWVGTASMGALKLARSGFVLYEEKDGIPEVLHGSIIAGDAGEILVVSGGFDLLRFDGEKFSAVKPAGMLHRSWGWSQLDFRSRVDGEWWVATTFGLLRYPSVGRVDDLARTKPSKIYTKDDGLFGNAIFRLFEDSRGDVWISFIDSGEKTLMRWERASEIFHGYTAADNLPPTNPPTAFAEDAAGNVWIGFYAGGVARYRGGKFRFYSTQEGFPGGLVSAIYSDRAGRVWIAISNSGLVRVDNPAADEPRFANVTVAEGLSSNQATCLTEDDFGRVYVGTGRGISRIEPATGRIKIYSKADGLPHSSVRVCARDSLGNLWFVQKYTLVRLAPEPDARAEQPPIFIGDLRVNGERARKLSELGEASVENFAFDSDGRQIQIDFFALGFAAGERLLYQYKLDGVDADWSEPTTQRSVNLNLSAGAYRFLVRAVNSEGAASERPAVVSFSIARPLWQRPWVLALATLLIATGIYALYRYRVAQLLRVERVRTRIATDLHDDIGASLSRVAILSEVVKLQTDGGAGSQSAPLLTEIADSARGLVDSMSDIVWSIDPRRDDLHNVVVRVRQFASDVLEARGIEWDFRVSPEVEKLKLDPEQRRHFYLIFKEGINNVVRHAGAVSSVALSIELAGGQLVGEIRDDGQGFTPKPAGEPQTNGRGGNGLPNMRSRAEQVGGRLDIESAPGAGTRLVLRMPMK